MENLSIITNFGCPYNCSFCITGSQQTKKTFIFNEEKMLNFKTYLKNNKVKRISLSGGGDPLFVHSTEIEEFYKWIRELSKEHKIHVHTNLNNPKESKIDLDFFEKITVSINENNYLKKYSNWSQIDKIVRYVHVSDGNDIELIAKMLAELPFMSQFTVKQLDSEPDSKFKEIKDLLNSFQGAMFLGSGDYNKYYFLDDNNFYDVFKTIKFR